MTPEARHDKETRDTEVWKPALDYKVVHYQGNVGEDINQ